MMKRKDERYEQWVEQVKRTSPVLKDPERTTAEIMSRITATAPVRTIRRRTYRGVWVSGIAAAVIVCFWISETVLFSMPDTSERMMVIQEPHSKWIPAGVKLEGKEMASTEKVKVIATAIHARQKKQFKRKELYTSIINKSINERIKRTMYENE